MKYFIITFCNGVFALSDKDYKSYDYAVSKVDNMLHGLVYPAPSRTDALAHVSALNSLAIPSRPSTAIIVSDVRRVK